MASFQLFAHHGPGHLGNRGCAAKAVKTRKEGGEEDDGNQERRGKRGACWGGRKSWASVGHMMQKKIT